MLGLFVRIRPAPHATRTNTIFASTPLVRPAARFFGFGRVEAARCSRLLAIPAIIAAGALAGYDLYHSGNLALGYEALVGAVLAFAVALVAIMLMMGWLRRA